MYVYIYVPSQFTRCVCLYVCRESIAYLQLLIRRLLSLSPFGEEEYEYVILTPFLSPPPSPPSLPPSLLPSSLAQRPIHSLPSRSPRHRALGPDEERGPER